MGRDYHRATSDSIPPEGERRPVIQPEPPQGHYSAVTGEWDGQLPHAEIAAQSQEPSQLQSPNWPNWPNLLQRMEWTRATIRAHKLPPPQAAVLNEIAYRDGRGRGCTATMETIALDTGYNEKSVRRAIKGLEKRQVILGHGGARTEKAPWAPRPKRPTLLPNPGHRVRGCHRSRKSNPGHRVRGCHRSRKSNPGHRVRGCHRSRKSNPGHRVRGCHRSRKSNPGHRVRGCHRSRKSNPGHRVRGCHRSTSTNPGQRVRG